MENAPWTVLPNAGRGVRTRRPLAGPYLSSPLTAVLMFCSPRRWKRWFPRDERRLSAPRAASCPVSAGAAGPGNWVMDDFDGRFSGAVLGSLGMSSDLGFYQTRPFPGCHFLLCSASCFCVFEARWAAGLGGSGAHRKQLSQPAVGEPWGGRARRWLLAPGRAPLPWEEPGPGVGASLSRVAQNVHSMTGR